MIINLDERRTDIDDGDPFADTLGADDKGVDIKDMSVKAGVIYASLSNLDIAGDIDPKAFWSVYDSPYSRPSIEKWLSTSIKVLDAIKKEMPGAIKKEMPGAR
jgi:hypothetical protein